MMPGSGIAIPCDAHFQAMPKSVPESSWYWQTEIAVMGRIQKLRLMLVSCFGNLTRSTPSNATAVVVLSSVTTSVLLYEHLTSDGGVKRGEESFHPVFLFAKTIFVHFIYSLYSCSSIFKMIV